MATQQTELLIAAKNAEQAIAKLRELGDAGERAFNRIKKASQETPPHLKAVDSAVVQLQSHMQGALGQFGALGSAIAGIAGPVGLLAGAAALTGGALFAMAKHAADGAGKLVDLADMTGVATTTLQAYALAGRAVGLDQAKTNLAFQTFAKNMGDVELGSGRLTAKLKALDPDFLKLIQTTGTVEQKFDLFNKRLAEVPSLAQQAALRTAAFTAEGAKIGLIAGTIEQVTGKYQKLNAVAGDETVRAMDKSGDAFDEQTGILRAQIKVLELEAGPAILRFATAWVSASIAVVRGLKDILANIGLISRGVETQLEEKLAALQVAKEREAKGANTTPQGQAAIATLQREVDLLQAQVDAMRKVRAERERAAAAQKQAGEDESKTLQLVKDRLAADKKATSEAISNRKAFLDFAKRAHEEEARAGADAIRKVEVERDLAYEQARELIAKGSKSEEEAADLYLTIWSTAEKKFTEIREQEAEKRRQQQERDDEKARAAAEREAEKQQRILEKQQEAFERPFVNAAENIQRELGDALFNAFDGGVNSAQDFADVVGDIIKRLAAEIAVALVIRPIFDGSGLSLGGIFGGGGATAVDGGGFNVLNLLGSGVGRLAGAFDALSFDSLGGFASSLDDAGTALLGLSSGAAAASSGLSSVTAGTGVFANVVAGGSSTAAGAAGIGGSLAGGALSGGILAAAVGALFNVTTILSLNKQNEQFLNIDQYTKAFTKSLGALGYLSYLAPGGMFTGSTAGGTINNQYKLLHGEGNALGVVQAVFDLLPLLFALLVQIPSKGTALRKGTEEFFEPQDGEGGLPFFTNSGSFNRTLGQAEGRAGIAKYPQLGSDLGFQRGLQDYIDQQVTSIGLTDKQVLGFKAMDTALLAFQTKAGELEGIDEHIFGNLAAILGNIATKGLDATDAMEVLVKAVEQLGPPQLVFKELADALANGALSTANYRDAIEGLAEVLFRDVPLGVHAGRRALEELDQAGADTAVSFSDLRQRIADVTAGANIALPVFQQLIDALATDSTQFFRKDALGNATDLIDPAAIQNVHDQILQATHDGAFKGLSSAFLETDFDAVVLEPYIKRVREALTARSALTSTNPADIAAANATAQNEIKAAAKDLAAQLKDLDPVIREIILAGRDLDDAFKALAGTTGSVGGLSPEQITKNSTAFGFNLEIQRQIGQLTGAADEQAFAQLNAVQRDRIDAATAAGADLVEVERLNGLQRAKVLEDLSKDALSQLERLAEQEQQIRERTREQAVRALQQISDVITSLTAGPASPFDPTVVLPQAEARFQKLLAAARGGDVEAAQQLPQALQDELAVAERVFGHTAAFFDIFNRDVQALRDVVGEGADAFTHLSEGDQKIVSEIDAQTTQLHRDLAELIRLSQPGAVAPAGTGGFGLSASGQTQLAASIAQLSPGGQTADLLAGLRDMGFLEAESQGFMGSLTTALRALFPTARSDADFRAIIDAILAKITSPGIFQPLLGFATQGGFQVGGSGGADSRVVMFRGTPGEYINVSSGDLVPFLRQLVSGIEDLPRAFATALRTTIFTAPEVLALAGGVPRPTWPVGRLNENAYLPQVQARQAEVARDRQSFADYAFMRQQIIEATQGQRNPAGDAPGSRRSLLNALEAEHDADVKARNQAFRATTRTNWEAAGRPAGGFAQGNFTDIRGNIGALGPEDLAAVARASWMIQSGGGTGVRAYHPLGTPQIPEGMIWTARGPVPSYRGSWDNRYGFQPTPAGYVPGGYNGTIPGVDLLPGWSSPGPAQTTWAGGFKPPAQTVWAGGFKPTDTANRIVQGLQELGARLDPEKLKRVLMDMGASANSNSADLAEQVRRLAAQVAAQQEQLRRMANDLRDARSGPRAMGT